MRDHRELPLCPICGSEPETLHIHAEYVTNCSNQDCRGPWDEDSDAVTTLAGSWLDWRRIVERHLITWQAVPSMIHHPHQ